MIEIEDGLFIDPWKAAAVKAVEEGKCLLFLDGVGAMDGFLLRCNALEAAQRIMDARYAAEDEEENGEDS